MVNHNTSQNMLQRYLALPSVTAARKSLIIYVCTLTFTIGVFCYNGLLIYATYHDCDPFTAKIIERKDQFIPLFVMDILGEFRGIPGIFVAGVFSASLSSLSTGLNSLSAVVLEDYVKPYAGDKLSERTTNYIMRGTVFIFGLMAVALVFVVEKLGTVLQMSMSLSSVTTGPLLGLFTMGVFMPWVDASSAMVGGISGIIAILYISLRAQAAIALGEFNFPHKPTSIEGCNFTFPTDISPTEATSENVAKSIHHISYVYYTLIGTVVSCLGGIVAGCVSGFQSVDGVDPKLFAPCIRSFIPKRKEIKAETWSLHSPIPEED